MSWIILIDDAGSGSSSAIGGPTDTPTFERLAAKDEVRDWMNSHSWLVNIIVCFIFIVLTLSG